MRLFAAVWPPDEVLDHLDLALGALRREIGTGAGPVRWSARETWHLTCAFYGEVPDGRVPELTGALAAVAADRAPYRLRLRGAGVFAHRTLWVGVGGDTAEQQALTREAVAAGVLVGAHTDDRPRDRAHLTVGRVRPNGTAPRGRPDRGRRGSGRQPGGGQSRRTLGDAFDPEGFVGALAVYEGPEWTVGSVRLVASRPGAGRGGGPLYVTVEEIPFRGSPGPVAPWTP